MKSKSKLHSVFYNNRMPILSFFITMLLMTIFYASNSVMPFGDKSILNSDCFHQYAPMLDMLIQRLQNGESLIYSSSLGLGTNVLGNIINYLISPFNLIALILGSANIQTSVALIILGKVSLSSFTFAYFIRKVYQNEKFSIPFSVMYSFCSFFLAYFVNIMWLDAFYMLPLLVFGIYQLIHKEKYVLYTVSLAYTIITNFYMGFMFCIASVIFFLYFYFSNYGFKTRIDVSEGKQKLKFVRVFRIFAISSIVSALLSCVVLIPIYFCLQNSSAVGNAFPNGLALSCDPLTFISQHFAFTTISFRSLNQTALANIYCGTIPLLLIPIYFISKRFTLREKVATNVVLFFFYLSFSLNILNFIWHGFHFPNDLPYRFSFIYSFFLLIMSYNTLIKIQAENAEETIRKKIGILLTISVPVVLLLGLFFAPHKGKATVVFTVCAFIIYGILLLCLTNKKKVSKIAPIVLSCLIVIEMSLPYFSSLNAIDAKFYNENTEDMKISEDYIKDIDDSFYRIETLKHDSIMDAAVNGYNSITSFSSMNYKTVALLQKYLGTNSNRINSSIYYGQTPVYNMMMGINYIFDNRKDKIPPLYDEYYTELKQISENTTLYDSNYKTGIGFASQNNLKDWQYNTRSAFFNQSKFIEKTTGISDIFIDNRNFTSTYKGGLTATFKEDSGKNQVFDYTYDKNNEEESTITITTPINETANYFAFVESNVFDAVHKTKDGTEMAQVSTGSYLNIMDLGVLKEGETLTTTLHPTPRTKEKGDFAFFICRIDEEKLDEAYSIIKNNGILNVIEDNGDYIKTEITTNENFIYTTIPYDKNWEIKIDGQTVSDETIVPVANALIGLNVSSGTHTIEFIYHQKGLLAGAAISTITLIGCIIFLAVRNKKKKERTSV